MEQKEFFDHGCFADLVHDMLCLLAAGECNALLEKVNNIN